MKREGQGLNPGQETLSIKVSGASKEFNLRHDKSLKQACVGLFKSQKSKKLTETNSFWALKDVDIEVKQGETLALLGYNGSGKSTLLKLISGVMSPDSGTVGVQGKVAGLIEVGAGFHPDLTGRDNVYLNGAILGMNKAQIDERFERIVEFSEIGQFIDTEVRFYSSGMYLRLAFSVAIHTDPDVFLVDEILAVGDEPFQKKCLVKINSLVKDGKTLVVVSHNLEQVKKICDRAVLLEHGSIVMDGETGKVIKAFRSR